MVHVQLKDESDKNKMKNVYNNEINMMIDVSTKIMNGLGFAQRSSDIFFIEFSRILAENVWWS